MAEEYRKCSHCHKNLTIDNYRRMNWKNTGQPQIFKTCNECINYKKKRDENIKIIDTKKKIEILFDELNKKINFHSPIIYT